MFFFYLLFWLYVQLVTNNQSFPIRFQLIIDLNIKVSFFHVSLTSCLRLSIDYFICFGHRSRTICSCVLSSNRGLTKIVAKDRSSKRALRSCPPSPQAQLFFNCILVTAEFKNNIRILITIILDGYKCVVRYRQNNNNFSFIGKHFLRTMI